MKQIKILAVAVFATLIIAFAPGWDKDGAGFVSRVFGKAVIDLESGTVELSGNIAVSDLANLKDSSASSLGINSIEAQEGSVLPQDCTSLFEDLNYIKKIDLSKADGSQVQKATKMFMLCSGLSELTLCDFGSGSLRDTSYMFDGCTNLQTIGFGKFDTSKVSDMSSMFYGCVNLTSLDFSLLDLSYVDSTDLMFYDCKSLENIDLSATVTNYLKSAQYMFCGCEAAKNIDVSNFNISSGTELTGMFARCTSLEELDLSSFDMRNTGDSTALFDQSDALKKLRLGENFGNVTRVMALPEGDNGWANINDMSVRVSNPTGNIKIANEGANTYIKIGEYCDGSGTEADPFIIYDYKQLYTLFPKYDKRLATVYFKLGADISTNSEGFKTIEKTGNADYYLDLAGHCITVDMTVTEDTGIFNMTCGTLTIGDSKTGGCIYDKISNDSDINVIMFNYKPTASNSVLTINNGNYIYESAEGKHTLINADAPHANGSKLNINGGVYMGKGQKAYIDIKIQDCETSIRNGDFIGAYITYTDVNEDVHFYSCTVTYGHIQYVPYSTNDGNQYVPLDAIKNMENAFPVKVGDFEPVLVDYVPPTWGKSSFLIGDVIIVRNYDFAPGDVDFDMEVSHVDAAIVLKYINGQIEFTAAQLENADIYDDDIINLTDVIQIINIAEEE